MKAIKIHHRNFISESTKRRESQTERCVLCGRETEYRTNTPIEQREGYITGGGQLCRTCIKKNREEANERL